MKRVSVEDGFKHQLLLEDYLRLQKKFVSKKKKLQATKEKRDSLFAEVRFLKRKRKYLLKIRSPEIELGNAVNSGSKRKLLGREIAESANEPTLLNQYPILASNLDLVTEEQMGRKKQEVNKELGIKKNTVCLIDTKAISKKKLSYPVTLKETFYIYCRFSWPVAQQQLVVEQIQFRLSATKC